MDWKKIVSWILRLLVFLGFLLASLGKLSNNTEVIKMFGEWGYPNGFHFFVGLLELVLALLILIPKTLKISIIGLIVIMIGALMTHLINDPIVETIRPISFLVILSIIYFFNFHLINKN